MAWLFLDTHEMGRVRVAWFGVDGVEAKELDARSQAALPLVEQLVDTRLQELEGICVVKGPGSFSAVRTGVLDANLLARLWKLPLVAVEVEEATDLGALAKRLAAGELAALRYVAPVYDAEPNITLPRVA
jgi:tRNA A37 threonylcarbamoyladenosine modification protein TsaB